MAEAHPTDTGLLVKLSTHRLEEEPFKEAAAQIRDQLLVALGKQRVAQPEHGSVSVSVGGSVIGSAIQAGSPGGVQSVSANLNVQYLSDILAKVKEELAGLDLSEDVRADVESDLDSAQVQLAKKRPNAGVVSAALKGALKGLITVGAAGKGIEYLQQLIHYLAPFLM
jgi:hypothetical protein